MQSNGRCICGSSGLQLRAMHTVQIASAFHDQFFCQEKVRIQRPNPVASRQTYQPAPWPLYAVEQPSEWTKAAILGKGAVVELLVRTL
jgi:hypothetical protein